MLEVEGLTKAFGERKAVNCVSFRANHGEIVGLLGPNGAGKTTTVSLVAGLLRPDSGEVLIEGNGYKVTPTRLSTKSVSFRRILRFMTNFRRATT